MHGKTNPSQFSRHRSPAVQAMVPERGAANVVCPTSSQITAWMVTRDVAAQTESLRGGISLVDRQQQSSWFFCGSSSRRQGSRTPSLWNMLIQPSCLSPALLGCAGPSSHVWCFTSSLCSSVTGLDRSRGHWPWSQAGTPCFSSIVGMPVPSIFHVVFHVFIPLPPGNQRFGHSVSACLCPAGPRGQLSVGPETWTHPSVGAGFSGACILFHTHQTAGR